MDMQSTVHIEYVEFGGFRYYICLILLPQSQKLAYISPLKASGSSTLILDYENSLRSTPS